MQNESKKVVIGPWSSQDEKGLKKKKSQEKSPASFYMWSSLVLAIVAYFISVFIPVYLEKIELEIIKNISILIRILGTTIFIICLFLFIRLFFQKIKCFVNNS